MRTVKWWSEYWIEKSLFMVQNPNGWLSHVTLPFEYQTPKVSGIRVSSNIRMVTVEFIQDKLVYIQVVTNCQYSVAQMCTWEECLPAAMGAPSCVMS